MPTSKRHDTEQKEKMPMTASEMGKKGSSALLKKRGSKHMRKIGKAGAEARWGK